MKGRRACLTMAFSNSLDVVSLVSEIDDAFDVEISVVDLRPENFNSVEAMMALIERLQEE